MVVLPATLSAAAAAAAINLWLSIRVGQVRRQTGISVGDGGNELLQRRMRAQLNFVENTAIVLILLGLIELARLDNPWLLYAGAIYSIGRVLHGLGMDGGAFGIGRAIGTLITMLFQLILGVWAVLIVAGIY